MNWYAAHLLNGFQRIDASGPITVFENIYLIEAKSFGLAKEKANNILEAEKADDRIEFDGVDAKKVYSKVRKIVSVSNPEPPQTGGPPSDGSEVSYLEYEIDCLTKIANLSAAMATDVVLIE